MKPNKVKPRALKRAERQKKRKKNKKSDSGVRTQKMRRKIVRDTRQKFLEEKRKQLKPPKTLEELRAVLFKEEA